jgi:predicted ATPase/class 3 adenylate cyclase
MHNSPIPHSGAGQRLPSGTVTFLFTDIEGSTKLAREHHEKWEALRNRHHAILRSAIETHNGYVFQIIGDAFCAAFHTAGDALRAAAKSQIALHAENWGDAPVKVRMGIHTGKAEIQENGEYHGYLAMSRIQRLMSAGHGGQVLISTASQELLLEDLPEDVSLRDLGERRLKDLIRPEHIYQLVIPGLPVDFPPLKTLEAYRHNLPVQLTSFIGREKEMEEIKQSLTTHRLVPLTGSGGTGKTRVSLQVAADLLDQFPEGVWFVELAALTDPNLIPETILSALGIPEQPGITTPQLLTDYLHKRKLLLVLDNCEHLIAACAMLADTLLGNAHMLQILATSREALGVTGEMIWHVPSLSLPDVKQLPTIEQLSQYEAVQLFIERARLVQPHFLVTNENAPALAQICFRLDGIPLAIELAAARVRALSVDQISRRLDDRFRLLTGGSRTALEHHQTLRATIDWSYNLLSDDEKLLLCRLSVFAGGWTLETAEQVCVQAGGDFDVLDLLARLVDKSLVILDGTRYHMLETTRQYAREKFLASSESEWVQNRHLDFFMKLAEEAETNLLGAKQAIWLERLEMEQSNLRTALKWGLGSNAEAGLRLVSALWLFWFMHAHFIEGRQWYDVALTVGRAASPLVRIRLLTGAASNSMGRGDFEQTAALSEQSLALSLEQSYKWGIAMSLHHLGITATAQGDYKQAQTLLEEGLVLSRETGIWAISGHILQDLGALAAAQGDYENAREFFEEGLALERKHQDGWGSSYALQYLAFVAYEQKDYVLAGVLSEQAIILAHEFGDRRVISGLLELMGMVALRQGQPARAALLISTAEALVEAIGLSFIPEEHDIIAVMRSQLGEDSFGTLQAQGLAMTMEQAIAYALDNSNG